MNRIQIFGFRRSGTLFAALAAWVVCGCQPSLRRPSCGPASGEAIRAIWVTRWDYKSPRDIAHVMENCRRAGFNTVLFQVRGNGTVMYRSQIEPWAQELGGRDPGFDPLGVACREAKRRGLGLHAWVNVVPGWRGQAPPADRRQLYWRRADWFWRDASGRREPLGWYNNLNPCYPEVRAYLASVVREIAERYPVDGVHLDYIRFPNDRSSTDYPRDAKTLAMFRRATGRTPDAAPSAWDAWRTEQVTQLVREIHAAVRRARPGACVSAAVGAERDEAKRKHFQDSHRWLSEGLLDAVYPMNYAADMRDFSRRLEVWTRTLPRRHRRGAAVVTGVMFDQRDAAVVLQQVERARRSGAHFAAFAYNSLFERLNDRGRPTADSQSANRLELRKAVIPHLK